ncbi:MAG: hypothetical protein ACRDPC_20375, partial [Solirubrobacteraceae bacterium]
MYAANAYVIRPAAEEDGFALRRLAELDSQSPLTGRIILAEVAGKPVAAMSLDEWRVVADPLVRSDAVRVHLRPRASGIEAHRRMPTVRERLLAGLRRPERDG